MDTKLYYYYYYYLIIIILLLFNCYLIVIIIKLLLFYHHHHHHHHHYTIRMSLSQAFLPGTSLEPAVIPTAQASHCSTSRIVCDVPSIAVFCSESIECFPGKKVKQSRYRPGKAQRVPGS